jgi:hypothetical protein
MVEHFLLQCPKYAHERWSLLRRIGGASPKLIKVLSNKKCLMVLINYVDATEQFKSSIDASQ